MNYSKWADGQGTGVSYHGGPPEEYAKIGIWDSGQGLWHDCDDACGGGDHGPLRAVCSRPRDGGAVAAPAPAPFDEATAPGLERMSAYLCPCARTGDGTCPSNTLCGGRDTTFNSLCSYWCGLTDGECAGLLMSAPDPNANPPRYEWRCALTTDKCKEVPVGPSLDFAFITYEDTVRCPGGFCSAESTAPDVPMHQCNPDAEKWTGVPSSRRLLVDEVLFESEGDSHEFEADVAFEGMDAPVADT